MAAKACMEHTYEMLVCPHAHAGSKQGAAAHKEVERLERLLQETKAALAARDADLERAAQEIAGVLCISSCAYIHG